MASWGERRTAMRQLVPALIAAVVLVGTVAAVPAAGLGVPAADDRPVDQMDSETNESNDTVAPGERLSGVLGVQEAELDGEMESRSFGLAVARAANDEARAALIAAEVNETGAELETLRERRADLEAARDNGSMSEGQYNARIAELASRAENVERMANQTANESQRLPAELLESKGVNVSAIRTLRTQANELGGQEVAEIARSIAGNADRAPDRVERGPGAAGPDRGDGAAADETTAANGSATADQPVTPDTSDGNVTATETDDRTRGGDGTGDAGNGGSAGR